MRCKTLSGCKKRWRSSQQVYVCDALDQAGGADAGGSSKRLVREVARLERANAELRERLEQSNPEMVDALEMEGRALAAESKVRHCSLVSMSVAVVSNLLQVEDVSRQLRDAAQDVQVLENKVEPMHLVVVVSDQAAATGGERDKAIGTRWGRRWRDTTTIAIGTRRSS
mmetsp:Transcript_53423/g.115999  ORF Transcript_53423/g.115999 Transcript_53423/m.115999 type:complete len:169 (-) Transcript_53423:1030-1536(-)